MTFDDFYILQASKFNGITSRTQVDTKTKYKNLVFNHSLISASMSHIDYSRYSGYNTRFASRMALGGSFHTFSRSGSFALRVEAVDRTLKYLETLDSDDWKIGSIKVGLALSIEEFFDNNCIIELSKFSNIAISLDIANGIIIDFDRVLHTLRKYEDLNAKSVCTNLFILGNFGSLDLLQENFDILDDISSEFNLALKVGIGSGGVCSTTDTTGIGIAQADITLHTREELNRLNLEGDILLISDGGIRSPSDYVKSMFLGADLVMAGSIFAKTKDACAEFADFADFADVNRVTKIIWGMASAKEKSLRNLPMTFIEGVEQSVVVDNVSVIERLQSYDEALRSALAYTQISDVKDFCEGAKCVLVKGV